VCGRRSAAAVEEKHFVNGKLASKVDCCGVLEAAAAA